MVISKFQNCEFLILKISKTDIFWITFKNSKFLEIKKGINIIDLEVYYLHAKF